MLPPLLLTLHKHNKRDISGIISSANYAIQIISTVYLIAAVAITPNHLTLVARKQ